MGEGEMSSKLKDGAAAFAVYSKLDSLHKIPADASTVRGVTSPVPKFRSAAMNACLRKLQTSTQLTSRCSGVTSLARQRHCASIMSCRKSFVSRLSWLICLDRAKTFSLFLPASRVAAVWLHMSMGTSSGIAGRAVARGRKCLQMPSLRTISPPAAALALSGFAIEQL